MTVEDSQKGLSCRELSEKYKMSKPDAIRICDKYNV